MWRFVLAIEVMLIMTRALFAQPLAGSYTVGGSGADFDSLQHAANALIARGVSGPVFFNIRPGTYVRAGSPGPVIVLNDTVAGMSSTNRVTFQPDVGMGGNVDNVVLQIDCDINTNYNVDREIIYVQIDNVTFRNLTFRDADSLDSPARYLVRVESIFQKNPTVEGLTIDGCKFVGTPYYTQGQQFGTDYGIYSSQLNVAIVSNNRFTNLSRAVGLDAFVASPGDSIDVHDNRFDHLYRGFDGSGRAFGSAIEVEFAHAFVRRNFVRQSTGAIAIDVVYPITAILEGNLVQGFYQSEMGLTLNSASQDQSDSVLVANNIVIGPGEFGSLLIYTRNTRILHNTILNTTGNVGVWVHGQNCRVINNIFRSVASTIEAIDLNGATGIISDYNVFFKGQALQQWFFARGVTGTLYTTFDEYRTATGLDSNSHFEDISFESDSLGIHLDECEAQNPVLVGTRLREVPVDFYGTRRDSVKPFPGAVEGVRLPFDMFADVYKSGLPGPAYSSAAGDLNGDSRPEIAVPDYDNNQVLVFHNNGASRSFSQTGILFPGFAPTLVRFFDLDHDSHQDLIVAGEANAIKVYWGDGSGSFSDNMTINTRGRPRSLDTGTVSFFGYRTIVYTEDNGFLPNTSFLGYLNNGNGRAITDDVVYAGDDIHGTHPDTIGSVLGDFVCTDLDQNGSQEVVALSIAPLPPSVYLFVDTTAGNEPWGHHDSTHFGTGTYLGLTSSIVAGDFDGDFRKDLLTTGASDNTLILLHNQGNRQFVPETIATSLTRGLAALDYDNDGDLDFVTANRTIDSLGFSVFLNDGAGHFLEKRNCFFPFASGDPLSIIAVDFDGDTKTDLAITTFDSLFVLYNLGGFNSTTEVRQNPSDEIPEGFTLFQNYPNPFNPSTRIKYSLPLQSHVAITIYNILGQETTRLVDEVQMGGAHEVEWNGRSAIGLPVSSGVYFYRIEARGLGSTASLASVRKMLLMK